MLSFWDPNFLGFDKWTVPGVPPRSRMSYEVRLTSLFYLDHCFLTIPPYPEMVLQSSENPSKIGSLSRVSHAANEANAPLFSHFHRPPFPLLLLKTIARRSRVQMHQQVRVLASTLLPKGSRGSAPAPRWNPLQTVLDPRPGSLPAHSAFSPAHILPKSCFQVLLGWALPRGQRPPSEFTLFCYANVGFQASRDQDGKEELREPE